MAVRHTHTHTLTLTLSLSLSPSKVRLPEGKGEWLPAIAPYFFELYLNCLHPKMVEQRGSTVGALEKKSLGLTVRRQQNIQKV